jgi:hypothetical protein
MARTVSRLYDTYDDAQRAVNALEAALHVVRDRLGEPLSR